jgi:hypothetical protein
MTMMERDSEAEARLIPDCIDPEDMAQQRRVVAYWIKKAEAAESMEQRMQQAQKCDMPQEFKEIAYWKWLSGWSHARTFREFARRAQQIVDRLEAQNALWLARDAQAIAELNRIAGLEGSESR